jgi:parallel beta-helix repeat protein
VNGPLVTFIEGGAAAGGGNGEGAIRCVYVGTNAVLSGFTLTNGHTRTLGDYYREWSGGGAWCELSGVLTNCTLSGNLASYLGGGAYFGTLNNCTLSGNSAQYGGGSCEGILNNCIVYYNTASSSSNYSGGAFNYSCTTPLPAGMSNISAEPRMASVTHLSASSPCIGKGNFSSTSGVDIDGEPWLNPPCMGADQFTAGSVTGLLSLASEAYTNAAVGFPVSFAARNEGRISASVWDFGGGTVVSNTPYMSYTWNVPGAYAVRLTGYNESNPGGVSVTVMVHVVHQVVHYADAGNATPVFPYTSWGTAATNIQQAIGAATVPGSLVLVTNGIYQTGGRAVYGYSLMNRVAVTNGVEVRSVSGPGVTWIVGGGVGVGGTNNGDDAIRCAYVGSNAVLSGFTLTNGHTRIHAYPVDTQDCYRQWSSWFGWAHVPSYSAS